MKKLNIILLSIAYCLLPTAYCFSQDPQFSQFYAAPLYLNPAFTGKTIKARFITNARMQWLGLSKAYNTYAFSLDQNYDNYNSGAGLMFVTDRAGGGSLVSNEVNVLYAYTLKLSKKIILKPGIQLGYNFRKIGLNDLVFGDQLDEFGNTLNQTSETFSNTKVSYADISTGVLLYSQKSWLGIALHHLNRPDQSFTDDVISRNPVKISIHAGTTIPVENESFGEKTLNIAPAILYKKQGKFDQFDMGVNFHYEPLVLGFWYRGNPLKRYDNSYANHDAVVALAGYKQNNFSFGYSYDITISKIRTVAMGSHEISLIYEFEYDIKKIIRREKGTFPMPGI